MNNWRRWHWFPYSLLSIVNSIPGIIIGLVISSLTRLYISSYTLTESWSVIEIISNPLFLVVSIISFTVCFPSALWFEWIWKSICNSFLDKHNSKILSLIFSRYDSQNK